MCEAGAIAAGVVSAIAAATSTTVSVESQKAAQRKTEEQARERQLLAQRALQEQRNIEQKGQEKIQTRAQDILGQEPQQVDQEAQRQTQQFLNALGPAQAGLEQSTLDSETGRVSNEFLSRKANASADLISRAAQMAKLLGRTNAYNEVLRKRNRSISDLGVDLNFLRQQSRDNGAAVGAQLGVPYLPQNASTGAIVAQGLSGAASGAAGQIGQTVGNSLQTAPKTGYMTTVGGPGWNNGVKVSAVK